MLDDHFLTNIVFVLLHLLSFWLKASVFCEVGELASGTFRPITQEKILSMGKKFAVFKSLGKHLYAVVVIAYTVSLRYERHVLCYTLIHKLSWFETMGVPRRHCSLVSKSYWSRNRSSKVECTTCSWITCRQNFWHIAFNPVNINNSKGMTLYILLKLLHIWKVNVNDCACRRKSTSLLSEGYVPQHLWVLFMD